MRVIPRSAVEISDECVSQAFPWSDGTLLDSRDTIEPRSRFLQESMPMQRSAFFRTYYVIADINGEGVTPISFDRRSWKRSVDQKSALVYAVWGNEATSDVEVVIAGDACRGRQSS